LQLAGKAVAGVQVLTLDEIADPLGNDIDQGLTGDGFKLHAEAPPHGNGTTG
jgi:hypothetical protein